MFTDKFVDGIELRYDMRYQFNVRSKADMCQFNQPELFPCFVCNIIIDAKGDYNYCGCCNLSNTILDTVDIKPLYRHRESY